MAELGPEKRNRRGFRQWLSKLTPRLLRRWFCLLVLLVLITISTALFFRLRRVLQECQTSASRSKDWDCQWHGRKYTDDAQPLVSLGDAAEKWLLGYTTGLDSIYGAVSDTTKNQALKGWEYDRDKGDVSMSRMRCQAAFPGLFGEIGRARSKWVGKGVRKEDVDGIEMSSGRVRVGVKSGKVFVLGSNLTAESLPRALAVLESLNEAVGKPGPSFVPDVEFVIGVDRQEEDVKGPVWVFDRREMKDGGVWLMPSPGSLFEGYGDMLASAGKKGGTVFGRQSRSLISRMDVTTLDVAIRKGMYSPNADVEGAMPRRQQLVAAVEKREISGNKTNKLIGVWTPTNIPQTVRQRGLSYAATARPWAEYDVSNAGHPTLSGIPPPTSASTNDTLSVLSSLCDHLILAHDSTFSIPLANALLCNSVLFTTKPQYISIYHSLLLVNKDRFRAWKPNVLHPVVVFWASKGAGEQNAVLVADDWGDLDFKVTGLLENPKAAEGMARNTVETFRRRYLTDAATACYWREMIRVWRSVAYKPAGQWDIGEKNYEKRSARAGRWSFQ